MVPRSELSSQPRPVVILTALNTEYRAVREHLISICASRHAGTVFEEGRVTGSPPAVILALTGEGNNGAAVLAERANSLFSPRALLFVGAVRRRHAATGGRSR